ncbi:MAG: hypothetical protein AAB955_03400 [Patescibacteria group bacterium]
MKDSEFGEVGERVLRFVDRVRVPLFAFLAVFIAAGIVAGVDALGDLNKSE